MTGTEHWRNVASLDDVSVREAILTGYKDGKPFSPYVPTFDLGECDRILDFGCGLGRNFPYLTSIAAEVVGYDLPEMIARAEGTPGVVLASDWVKLRSQQFDLIFASLVWQHIEPGQLADYLADIFSMAPRCYVLSRGRHDFGGPTMRFLPSNVTITDGRLVEHDKATNRLVPVGPITADDIVRLDDDRHCETIVKR